MLDALKGASVSDNFDATNNEQSGNQRQESTEPTNVGDSVQREFGDDYSNKDEQTPGDKKKPAILVRFWHALWRKRIFSHRRERTSPANWAEKTTVILTVGIVVAAFLQAFIYWRQARIMREPLNQNERSIILGQGQLMVAARNAKTAENILVETRNGESDTRTLAEAAKKQAEAAQRESITTREALTSVQRPFIFFGGKASATKTIVEGKITDLVLSWPWENTGVTPTKNARDHTNWLAFPDAIPSNFDFPDVKPVDNRQFEIAPRSYANSTMTIPVYMFDQAKQGHVHIFVWGWITYDDIFTGTKMRLAEFCDEITNVKSTKEDITDSTTDITWELSLCKTHNCADEQCTDYKQRTH
jgi:hypothetical protein